MASTPSTVIATRVDPQTAECFRRAMARVGSTPSAALRIMIAGALAGPVVGAIATAAPVSEKAAA